MERKPQIETIDGQKLIVLTDKGRYLAMKKLWPCNSRPVNIDDFQIMFTTEEIRDARFKPSPKGNGIMLRTKTEHFGEEKFLITETIQDIEKLVNFKLKRQ